MRDGWVARADAAVKAVLEGFEARMGYPPGVNEIVRASDGWSSRPDWPSADIAGLFTVVDELSWPDVWNGYFLGPREEMHRRYVTGDLDTVAVGSREHRAFPLGSDGGGSLYVADLDDAGVVLRVADAVVTDGLLHGTVTVLAPDVDGFLEQLVRSAEVVAEGGVPPF